jgi:hypothetical protein
VSNDVHCAAATRAGAAADRYFDARQFELAAHEYQRAAALYPSHSAVADWQNDPNKWVTIFDLKDELARRPRKTAQRERPDEPILCDSCCQLDTQTPTATLTHYCSGGGGRCEAQICWMCVKHSPVCFEHGRVGKMEDRRALGPFRPPRQRSLLVVHEPEAILKPFERFRIPLKTMVLPPAQPAPPALIKVDL